MRHAFSSAWGVVFVLLPLASPAAAPPNARAELVNAASRRAGCRELDGDGAPTARGEALIDGRTDDPWDPRKEEAQTLLELAEPFDLERIDVTNLFDGDDENLAGMPVKKLKVEASTTRGGPWKTVGVFLLQKAAKKPQPFTVDAKGVRYLRITPLENWGDSLYVGLLEFAAWGRRVEKRTADFTGAWAQSTYGELRLRQEGSRVTGCTGRPGEANGLSIEGTVEGPILVAVWSQMREAEEPLRGGFVVALTKEGNLSGHIANDIAAEDGARFDGTRSKNPTIECKPYRAGIADRLEKEKRAVLRGILFDTDKDVIRAESIPVLEELLEAMKVRPEWRFEIGGHTDDRGGAVHNQPLSERRAASVKSWLVDRKVDTARLSAKGFGASAPVLPNDTEAGRAANRRVEVVVVE